MIGKNFIAMSSLTSLALAEMNDALSQRSYKPKTIANKINKKPLYLRYSPPDAAYFLQLFAGNEHKLPVYISNFLFLHLITSKLAPKISCILFWLVKIAQPININSTTPYERTIFYVKKIIITEHFFHTHEQPQVLPLLILARDCYYTILPLPIFGFITVSRVPTLPVRIIYGGFSVMV